MSKRDTRRRIVEAVVALHEEIGPAATSVTAIAERAGVQRLTVYRHFPDDRALLGACSAHWLDEHPLPDPSIWMGIDEPRRRLGVALEQLYSHYDRPRTAILMGHARGVICLAAAEANTPTHHYAATQIKKILTGNGRANKSQVQHAIQRELDLGTLPEPPDVADRTPGSADWAEARETAAWMQQAMAALPLSQREVPSKTRLVARMRASSSWWQVPG